MSATPTLDALQALATSQQARDSSGAGLSDIGLIVGDPEVEFLRGDETPVDSYIFAHTGGDAVHFCLLEVSRAIVEQSPVVMVVPCNPDEPRLVVGDTLREFLALGAVIGFAFVEQLVYDRAKTLKYLFDYDAYLRYCYSGPDAVLEHAEHLANQERLLAELRLAFDLRPWPAPAERLRELESKWAASIRLERE